MPCSRARMSAAICRSRRAHATRSPRRLPCGPPGECSPPTATWRCSRSSGGRTMWLSATSTSCCRASRTRPPRSAGRCTRISRARAMRARRRAPCCASCSAGSACTECSPGCGLRTSPRRRCAAVWGCASRPSASTSAGCVATGATCRCGRCSTASSRRRRRGRPRRQDGTSCATCPMARSRAMRPTRRFRPSSPASGPSGCSCGCSPPTTSMRCTAIRAARMSAAICSSNRGRGTRWRRNWPSTRRTRRSRPAATTGSSLSSGRATVR